MAARKTLPLRLTLVTSVSLSLTSIAFPAPPPLEGTPFWQTSEEDVYSTGMIWRDCNNDGIIDVFISNGNDINPSRNAVYLSRRGTLRDTADWYSSNAEYSGHCAVGDIDDDGWPDLLVADYLGSGFGTPNRSDLYRNYGFLPARSPTWSTPDSIFSFSCALGDVDGDGDLDAAFATGEGYRSDFQPDLIYLNENGTFSSAPYWQSDDSTAAYDVCWGDIDNDGDLDLAFTYESHATAVFYNDAGVLETAPRWRASTVESGNTLMFGDIDGDGWQDLVVAYNNQQGGEGRFRVYYNDGAGMLDTLFGWQSSTGGYGSALALYDYDHDGDVDLAAGRWYRPAYVYENLGGTFSSLPVWTSTVSIVTEELAWVDVDGADLRRMADTIGAFDGRKLFYTERQPLYAVDSVVVDGFALDHSDYCYDLVSGWISLADTPAESVEIYYRFSYANDLAASDWGSNNVAFANTRQPDVRLFADTTDGSAPLTVQFSDSTEGATEWQWHFGDGSTSSERSPQHVYDQGGTFTVDLEVTLPHGVVTRTAPGLIRASADTVRFTGRALYTPSYLSLPVLFTNTQPVYEIILPIKLSGTMGLTFLGWNTTGCRTDYFETINLISYDATNKVWVFLFRAGQSSAPLQPGSGPILNLEIFQYANGILTIDTTTKSGHSLSVNGFYSNYQPGAVAGHVYTGMCGNLDGSENGLIDMNDITFLIAYLYISGQQPPFIDQANVDGSPDGIVNIMDLVYLIAYLYMNGPRPVCPPY
jgi:PKD repeat protein